MSIRLASDFSQSRRNYLWMSCAAFSMWLGFPNDLVSLPPAVLLWPGCLAFVGLYAPSFFRAVINGWLAMWAGAFAVLYWLCLPVAQVGELPWPLAILCAALISFCISLQGGIFSGLAHYLRDKSPASACVLLGIGWYLLEYGCALAMSFPWLPLAGALAQWPVLIQGVGLVGAYCLDGALVFTTMLLLYFLAGRFRSWAPALMAACIWICLLGYGAWRLYGDEPRGDGEDIISALIIEGNIDQNQKWNPAFQLASLEKYIDLTNVALGSMADGEQPDSLIIWPETALPFFFERSASLAALTRDAVKSWGIPLLFGAPGVGLEDGREQVFNRAFLLDKDGRTAGMYDKRQLVPFGEYLPDWLNLDFLEALLQGVGVYSEGTGAAPLRSGQLALGVLICYEGIFPWLAQETVSAGANILVDISNDGWFMRTPAARQHLYLTVPRCVEQGRWLIRGTNTGLSAIVDKRGRIQLAGPMFEAGYLRGQASLETETTFFHKTGSYLPIAGLLFFLAFMIMEYLRIPFKQEYI